MPLAPGSRLGPYEIVAPIAAGGMGEVLRARDTRLKRDVAIKVLPAALTHDPERLARFRREAELLAALNHPNIAIVHGLEDTNGVQAIVMELVEGGTLAARISAQGPLPLDEALAIARAVAEAVEAAHEKGIIHRDLKPGNIAFTADGLVKVLDFGLAKSTNDTAVSSASVVDSPTLTSPAMTAMGLILGTAAYMSPEQAKGRPADKRSDIWAFGCVLFEMLTGKRPFEGEDVSDTLAAVLRGEPDWSALPATLPPNIHTLLARCLQKDRKKRLGDLSTAIYLIDEPRPTIPSTLDGVVAAGPRGRFGWVTLTTAMTAAAAIALAAVYALTRPATPTRDVVRFTVTAPEGTSLVTGVNSGVSVSPDGRHLVLVITRGAGRATILALRSLDALDAQILAGTEDGLHPFWSPDSRFIAFFAGARLRKIAVGGGPVQDLCAAAGGLGGTWNADGTILFGAATGPIQRVSQGGGTPAVVTSLDPKLGERSHRWPWFLPDGRHFVYLSSPATLSRGSLDSSEQVVIVTSGPTSGLSKPLYSGGHLLWAQDGALMARPFDAKTLQFSGAAFPIQRDVYANGASGTSSFDASASGVLAYRSGRSTETSQIVWMDRAGRRLGTVGDPADQLGLVLSHDGSRAVVSMLDPAKNSRDLMVYDLARGGARTRFTFDAADEYIAVWSPDGSRVVFDSARTAAQQLDLYIKASNGATAEQLLYDEPANNAYPTDWSSDGKFVLFHTGAATSATGNDIYVLPMDTAKPTPQVLVQTPFNEQYARFSPDGRWVAYQSNESGTVEVFVTPFQPPESGVAKSDRTVGKWQISRESGNAPRWSRDGKELFYFSPTTDEIMAAGVLPAKGDAFDFSTPHALFKARIRSVPWLGYGTGSNFDVAPDGQRFLVNLVERPSDPLPYVVVMNWAAGIGK